MDVITDSKTLKKVCAAFSKSPFITVDTEFLRETTFWPQLCLIQMADLNEAVIVDALSPGLDMQPFLDLMCCEDTLKVFHAARQDIEIIYQMGDFVPVPIFDTQIAAMVCGFGDSVSYGQLVQKITGNRIDKSNRYTDWSRRPLSESQLNYALADVTHLRSVYQFLEANLAEQNRAHWVREEMTILTAPDTYRQAPENAWKRLKKRAKSRRDLAALKALAQWRESEAQERNVPRGRVLKDETIYELSAQKTVDEATLSRLRGLPRGFERSKSGQQVIELLGKVRAMPETELPRLPKTRTSPEGASAAVELLKVLMKMVCEANGVAGKVIATVDDLEKIVADDEADVPCLKGWRRELFGNTALALKHGELSLTFNGRALSLTPTQMA